MRTTRVDWERATAWKGTLLARAWEHFRVHATAAQRQELAERVARLGFLVHGAEDDALQLQNFEHLLPVVPRRALGGREGARGLLEVEVLELFSGFTNLRVRSTGSDGCHQRHACEERAHEDAQRRSARAFPRRWIVWFVGRPEES